MFELYMNNILVEKYYTLDLAVYYANVLLDDGEDFLLTIKHNNETLFEDWASNTPHLSLI